MDAKSQRGGMCLVYGGHVKADEHHVNERKEEE